ncbi:MAG: radical SAM protein [Nanoarchaeota archaeon]|nr:radical SAM protein [Nanoarchaeota archaeon]
MRNKVPKKILYYIYTPYIRHKSDFMKKLSKISRLYLVIVPFFWKDKILKEFPFVKGVYYDGEKALNINSTNAKINYNEFDLDEYLDLYTKCNDAFPVLVSKYCPYGCTYCNARRTGLMDRNLEDVRNEVEYLKSKGAKKIVLCGNNLTINKKRFIEMCKMMKKTGMKWEGDGRVDHMKEEMYNALNESNGTLLFGVESANQNVLDKMQKGVTVEKVIEVADNLNKLNVPFRYTFMFGFPWDSYDSCKEMIDLKRRVGALNYHCNFVNAYPGTPLFEEMKKLKLVDENELDFENFSWANLPLGPTLHLKKEEVEILMKKIMIKGVFNKSVIKNILKTRKITQYPAVVSKGIKLLISGKRTWKK